MKLTLSVFNQLNDSTVAFLMDINDPYRIVTFNWISKTYSKRVEGLSMNRTRGNCAVLRPFKTSQLVVAAAGWPKSKK